MSRFSRYGIGSNRGLRSRRFVNESKDEILEYVFNSVVRYLNREYPDYPTDLQGWVELEPNRLSFYLEDSGEFGINSSFARDLMNRIVGSLEKATEGNFKREGFDVFKDDNYIIVDI